METFEEQCVAVFNEKVALKRRLGMVNEFIAGLDKFTGPEGVRLSMLSKLAAQQFVLENLVNDIPVFLGEVMEGALSCAPVCVCACVCVCAKKKKKNRRSVVNH